VPDPILETIQSIYLPTSLTRRGVGYAAWTRTNFHRNCGSSITFYRINISGWVNTAFQTRNWGITSTSSRLLDLGRGRTSDRQIGHRAGTDGDEFAGSFLPKNVITHIPLNSWGGVGVGTTAEGRICEHHCYQTGAILPWESDARW